ncbi:MBL fold metallo-hydrolase, partial [Pseudomonas aeruginosa]|nr:MBL fold metallo-hydrolase [Pseudomonas aeruginosa]
QLRLEVYNPRDKPIFAVSSELLLGQRESVLIDAHISGADAEQLVKRIQASGKTLSTIYISHGAPDFYFGLDVLKAAFPEAKILATAHTVAHIQATKDAKLA